LKKSKPIDHETDLLVDFDFNDLLKDIDLTLPVNLDIINPFNPFSGQDLKNHAYLHPDKKGLSIEIFSSDPETFKLILSEFKKTLQRLNVTILQGKPKKC